jgi:Zn-dependent peptidase ImmA (M78 family)/DNA-binding XRE family transcriptional regulator
VADKAPITPKVLRWARESAKMPIEVAASKVSVSADRLNDWENGVSQPTINQAQILAKSYKRSFALLFLPEPPGDFQPLQDYRRDAAELSTASIFIIREIQQKQAWISDTYAENGEESLPFVGKFSIRDEPDIVAADILRTLDINPPQYNTGNPVKEWTDKAEAKGIFISRSSFIHSNMKFDSDEMKGFAIVDKYAPFVFINTEDWKAPQLFTLVHELVHIWIGESGVSNEADFKYRLRGELHPVEVFCNQVAAVALMPEASMNRLPDRRLKSIDELFKTGKEWGVSSFALLVRAYLMGRVTPEEYQWLKGQADKAFRAYVQKEEEKKDRQKKDNGSGPSYYLLQLNRNSRLFTQLVLDAYKSGTIQPTQASSLLNVKSNNFHKLEAILYPQV